MKFQDTVIFTNQDGTSCFMFAALSTCGFKRLNLAEMASLPAAYLEFRRKAHPEAVLDCHLMIVEPEQRVEDFAKAGADIISVHCEAPGHLHGEGGWMDLRGVTVQ